MKCVGKIAVPQNWKEETKLFQARQYEVLNGMEYIIQLDPDDGVMKLYTAEDLTTPMEEIGLKSFTEANFFAGNYGATNRLRHFKDELCKLELGFKFGLDGIGFNFAAKDKKK